MHPILEEVLGIAVFVILILTMAIDTI